MVYELEQSSTSVIEVAQTYRKVSGRSSDHLRSATLESHGQGICASQRLKPDLNDRCQSSYLESWQAEFSRHTDRLCFVTL